MLDKAETRLSREGETIRLIRDAVHYGRLASRFRAANVNVVIGITSAGAFLPKHCGTNGKRTELFVRLEPGLYRLK
jgi:hypothetical protein